MTRKAPPPPLPTNTSTLQTPGSVRPDPQLLQDREAPLPDRRVRAPVRGGAGVLGPGQ